MLLVTDLDGTLLTSQNTISPRTRQALYEFHQRGGLLAACSARPVSSMTTLLQQHKVAQWFSWCAGFNGGQIITLPQQQVIHSATLSCRDIRDITSYISLSRYMHHFFSEKVIYHCEKSPVPLWTLYESTLFSHPLINTTTENIFNRRDIYKITLVAEQEEIPGLCAKLNNQLPDRFNALITGDNYIDIQLRGINKGYAVNHIIHQSNISIDEVIAIGDQQNDVSMFRAAGIGIAMGNAPCVVKREANFVTTTNDDEGIVYALEWLRCSAHPVTMRQSTMLAENNEPDKKKKTYS
ncbi:HAD family phosphatase [Shigella flexneri]